MQTPFRDVASHGGARPLTEERGLQVVAGSC